MTNLEKMLVTLDPRDENDHGPALLAPRPSTLNGKTLGLLSNNKPHSEEFVADDRRDHERDVRH